MKCIRLMLVMLILFMTIAAVAAGNNQTEIIRESFDAQEDVLASSDAVISVDDVVYEDNDDDVIKISTQSKEGNVSVSVDDVEYVNKELASCYFDEEYNNYIIMQKEIAPLLNLGKYNLTVKYKNVIQSKIVNTKPLVEITTDEVIDDYWKEGLAALAYIHDADGVNGTVTITIDNVECLNKTYVNDTVLSFLGFGFKQINKSDFTYSNHSIKVVYKRNNWEKEYVAEGKFTYAYEFFANPEVSQESQVYPSKKFKNKLYVHVNLPEDAKNNVRIAFNGKTYNLPLKRGELGYYIDITDLKVGTYELNVTYGDSKYPLMTKNEKVNVLPYLIMPYVMANGEDEKIEILAHPGATGEVKVYNGNWYSSGTNEDWHYNQSDLLCTFTIKDGYGQYSLKKFPVGSFDISFEYNIDGKEGYYLWADGGIEDMIHMEVKKNTNGISSSISSKKINVGDIVTLKYRGPKSKSGAVIYIDGKEYKTVSTSKGKFNLKIKSLKKGKHKISIKYQHSKDFHAKTYYVTVNKVTLKLNKVTVRKSSKKLVLKATLKINGKLVKGKKITFKFNKKTYNGKTNKKGIAKVTIKKSTLKKLKKGRKVTCLAKYSTKTVKRIVKVK